ncbi:carboxymuconolactone decarboxylase family protein [Streptomyces sp. NRRL F-5123]|uniref:carboxymuconolactone decarboxylase family protein n=1 Tax=Streptomyces sp. NRRL F-5123 TaxID=1463856 RepID=UPI0004E0F329|nr:carboxymuconolactone decarboxylase family protein [Streptomyces sp. NRRL F-5123]
MEARATGVPHPDVITGIRHLTKAVQDGGADPRLLALVHVRVSQINGCSPCVHAGVAAAKKHGESEERLHAVAAWRETPFFSTAERAALTLAEAATRLQDGAPAVTPEIRTAAASHFTESQLAAIILETALTNFFNRLNRVNGTQAGTTW